MRREKPGTSASRGKNGKGLSVEFLSWRGGVGGDVICF